MNARTKPAPPYTAQQLVDMPYGESRRALSAQECAFMQEKFGKKLLLAAQQLLAGSMDVARVTCIQLEGPLFCWEAFPACDCCGGAGLVAGANNKLFDCPNCRDEETEYVYTNYDGEIVEAPV